MPGHFEVADPDGEGGRNLVADFFAVGTNFVGGNCIGRERGQVSLVPFVLALEHEGAVLQQNPVDKVGGMCLLHLNIYAESVRGSGADVKFEGLGNGEYKGNFGVLDGYRGDFLFAL